MTGKINKCHISKFQFLFHFDEIDKIIINKENIWNVGDGNFVKSNLMQGINRYDYDKLPGQTVKIVNTQIPSKNWSSCITIIN